MMKSKQLRYAYIRNELNNYVVAQTSPQRTGWHIIPNNRLYYYLSPKDMYFIHTNCKAITIKSVTIKVFNMIPVTNTVAIGQGATFSAFNNTIYAIAYSDVDYITYPHDYRTDDEYAGGSETARRFFQREGIPFNIFGEAQTKNFLPDYSHRGSVVNSVFVNWWDPLTDPDNVQELRPGKNAIEFHWKPTKPTQIRIAGRVLHSTNFKNNDLGNDYSDLNITTGAGTLGLQKVPISQRNEPALQQFKDSYGLFNTTAQQCWGTVVPNEKLRRPNDAMNYISYGTSNTPGIENKPLPQWFIKMVPILDDQNSIITAESQICMMYELEWEPVPYHELNSSLCPVAPNPFPSSYYHEAHWGTPATSYYQATTQDELPINNQDNKSIELNKTVQTAYETIT